MWLGSCQVNESLRTELFLGKTIVIRKPHVTFCLRSPEGGFLQGLRIDMTLPYKDFATGPAFEEQC